MSWVYTTCWGMLLSGQALEKTIPIYCEVVVGSVVENTAACLKKSNFVQVADAIHLDLDLRMILK